MKPIVALSLFACCLVTGCVHDAPLTSNAGLTVVDGQTLPSPDLTVSTEVGRPYLVGPGDKISIDVFGNEQLARRQVLVDSSGSIGYPLIGFVKVSGLTASQISDLIAQQLRQKYLRDPQVTVAVDEAVSQTVTVDGEVQQPGLYPVAGKMTLMRAVATARGTTEFAKLEDVVVFRTVGNRRMAALYNLQAIRRGYYADPDIYPNDVVIVGDSPARRAFRNLIQAAPLLTTPILALLR